MDGPVSFEFRRSSTCSRADANSIAFHHQSMGGTLKFTNEYLLSTLSEHHPDLVAFNNRPHDAGRFLRSAGGRSMELRDTQHPCTFSEPGDPNFVAHMLGEPGTALFRSVFQRRSDGCVISPWHDIPLYDKECQLRCICTTPSATSLQHCFSTDDPFTPLRCRPEEQEGSRKQHQQHPFWVKSTGGSPELESVSHFVSACPWNVGILPQTLHSKEDVFFSCPEFSGSGVPVEIIEIGGRRLPLGVVVAVKPVAAFAVQSGPSQFCWKIVGVAGDNPAADKISNIRDVEAVFPGELQKVQDWLAMCCSYSDSSEAFPSPQGPDEALVAIAQANATWQLFVEEALVPHPVEAPQGLTTELLSQVFGDRAWLKSCHLADEDPLADNYDAEVFTPTSAKNKKGVAAGAAGFQGFGKLLRTASVRCKTSSFSSSGNPRTQRKQSSSRPPTAPHPSYMAPVSAAAASQQLPWQHSSGTLRPVNGDASQNAEGQRRKHRKASASIDLGRKSVDHEQKKQQQAEHVRRKSDTTLVEGGWGDMLFVDGSSPVHSSAVSLHGVGYTRLGGSPGCSPGYGSPAGYASPVEHGSPLNEAMSRKQADLSPCRNPATPSKSSGSGVVRNRSYNSSAGVQILFYAQTESFSAIPQPRSSTVPRSGAQSSTMHRFGLGSGEGGHVSAGGWPKGQSHSRVSDTSPNASADVLPRSEGMRGGGGEGGWARGGRSASSAFPRSHSATSPQHLSPGDLSPNVGPPRERTNRSPCRGYREREERDGGQGSTPFVFPRSRSATAPQRTTHGTESGAESMLAWTNPAGKRVRFREEVDMVLLLDDEEEGLLDQGHPGEGLSSGSEGIRRNERGLHVSMPLSQDGEGPALGSPRLVTCTDHCMLAK